MTDLVTAWEAAALIRATGRPCTPSTVRTWARRGHLAAKGRRGNAQLYDLDEVRCVVEGRSS